VTAEYHEPTHKALSRSATFEATTRTLSDSHSRQLAALAIDPTVAEERGTFNALGVSPMDLLDDVGG
jgi:hypothetical protein